MSVMTNCYLVRREGDGTMFHIGDTISVATLDGYAIVPIEEYGKHTRKIKRMAKRRGENVGVPTDSGAIFEAR